MRSHGARYIENDSKDCAEVELRELGEGEREEFILENQWAFKYGAVEEFGVRDEHYEEDGEIISRRTIEECLDRNGNRAYMIIYRGEKVGGAIVRENYEPGTNELEILFVKPGFHGLGIGAAAFGQLERLYPDATAWETFTPYFEKRNIHFYVNKLGFSIAEFFCQAHSFPSSSGDEGGGPDEMFRFRKETGKR